MKQVSGSLRRFAPHTVMFSLAGALLFAATGLIGCSGRTTWDASSLPPTKSGFAPARALVQPECYSFCKYREFVILPKSATVKLNQHIRLHDEIKSCRNSHCGRGRAVEAAWRAYGGSLKAKHGGKEATFWASFPGVYKVIAGWQGYEAAATVTVTSP